MRDAGGSRTHFNRVAAGRLAVRLRRLRDVLARSRTWPSTFAGSCALPHTPRTFTTPTGSRTRPCGSEGRRVSATPAGTALVRSRTWSATSGGSRAVRHTPRARTAAGAQGVEPCPSGLGPESSPGRTPLSVAPAGRAEARDHAGCSTSSPSLQAWRSQYPKCGDRASPRCGGSRTPPPGQASCRRAGSPSSRPEGLTGDRTPTSSPPSGHAAMTPADRGVVPAGLEPALSCV